MKPRMITIDAGSVVLSSTGRQKIGGANVSAPSWAKELLNLECAVVPDGFTTGEPVLASVEVESQDVSINPFLVLPCPVNSTLFSSPSSISTFVGKPERYLMGVPLNGSEEIEVYGNGGFNHTTEPYTSATLVFADAPWVARNGRIRQRHAKLGTVTVTGTTASTPVNGTKYQISGADHIIETLGVVVGGTQAINDAWSGYFEFTSNDFDDVSRHQMRFQPLAGSPAVTGGFTAHIAGVTRQPCDLPTKTTGQTNIQDSAYFNLIAAAEGRFWTGVIYE